MNAVHVPVRSFRRPDQPQPVYPQIVDVAVAKWAPIWSHESQLSRTVPRPPLDVLLYDWKPEDGWQARVVDAVVATWIPVFDAEASAQTPGRPGLDVRLAPSAPLDGWIFQNLPQGGATVAQLWPAVLASLLSFRTGARPSLDVRGAEWSPEPAWMPSVVDGIVQTWMSAIDAKLRSYRSPAGPAVEVRRVDQPESITPLPRVLDAIIAKWIAVFDAEVSYRTPDGVRLNVRDLTRDAELAFWLAFIAVFYVSTTPFKTTSDGDARTSSNGDVRSTE